MSNSSENDDKNGKKKFNLSAVALDHSSVVWYFMIVFMVAGVMSYINLGREEDPDFTIKTMVIQALWPGASVEDTVNQVTERIEKKLEELDALDYTKSVTVPGQTTIYVYLLDKTKNRDVRPTWVTVRNYIADIQAQLPQGVIGPFFNDRFGDVFGNIYAFTADGLTAAAIARLCRGCPHGHSHLAQYGQGRSHRRPGRGDLPRILSAPDRESRP